MATTISRIKAESMTEIELSHARWRCDVLRTRIEAARAYRSPAIADLRRQLNSWEAKAATLAELLRREQPAPRVERGRARS